MYVLDLHYEKEARLKGDDPMYWRPTPRTRPDHFANWAVDVVTTLDGRMPYELNDLVNRLHEFDLPRIARVVRSLFGQSQRSVERASSTAATPLPQVKIDPAVTVERHPQARKFAKTITEELDQAWLGALRDTAREFEEIGGLPAIGLVLGGLPPSYRTICSRILPRDGRSEPEIDYRSLTCFQFYGLVTGTAPEPPADWQPAIGELALLDRYSRELLSALSDSQISVIGQTRPLDWRLAITRQKHGLSKVEWRELRAELAGIVNGARPHGGRVVTRVAVMLLASDLAQEVRSRLAAPISDWDTPLQLDEELLRLYRRGKLSPVLLDALQRWPDSMLGQVRQLIADRGELTWDFLEDVEVVKECFRARTGAQLVMRNLFPRSVEWLDRRLTENLEESLTFDVEEASVIAEVVSDRVQERFWCRLLTDEVKDIANV